MKKQTMLISQQKITPKWSDLFQIFKNNYNKCQNKDILKKYLSKQHFYWTGSGREALRQILLNLNIKKVGVPAFTCYVVPETVKIAHKEVIYYDSGVIVEFEEIKKIIDKVDAIIISYNFGFIPEIDKIATLCKKKNVILIEDCAQALGARYKEKLVGGYGDYAFYSFGISKNIGFCGGMISSNRKIRIKSNNIFPKKKLIKVLIEILIAPLFFNKHVYPFSRKILSKELNKKQESLAYQCPKIAIKVIIQQFKRYNKILKVRQENAKKCLNKLKESQINFIKPLNNSNPAWLYFCILTDNRDLVTHKLLKEGVELGKMKTFQCFDENCKKSLQTEKETLTFALYRPKKEIKIITKKIIKVENEER
jgi:dTDP-4-amino-4,6-dideoxygalactose transaminase